MFATRLSATMLLQGQHPAAPLLNSVFAPPPGARAAPPFNGILGLAQATLRTDPSIEKPVQDGRDARLFPAASLEFFTDGDRLVPVMRGEMVAELPSTTPSFWHVIPQIGRIWREDVDDGWSRAAFPLMLVNDTDNDAHQGLAIFLYRELKISDLVFQFPQQSAPYLLGQPFLAWGATAAKYSKGATRLLAGRQEGLRAELARRLPTMPWSDLLSTAPPGALDGFGGPLDPERQIIGALVRDGTLYYQDAATDFGPYPYPLEMRFGVRSVMKSIGVPLALLHLAQVHGPQVLHLRVGDYVAGLDEKWKRVRFMDAANMASGFGGTGTLTTDPNDSLDGYQEGGYDEWYTAKSHAEKVAVIASNWRSYPWEPGSVVRYRDQDFYLLGAALDALVKSLRGPTADLWTMLVEDVLKPIGIPHAPAVRTREPGGRVGLICLNAGLYPTLDDLAKVALLYQAYGRHGSRQLLHAPLTQELLASRRAIPKNGNGSAPLGAAESRPDGMEFYQMGFHFTPYRGSLSHQRFDLPTMCGYGNNEVTLYPNGMVSIVMGNASTFDPGHQIRSNLDPLTQRVVDRLLPV